MGTTLTAVETDLDGNPGQRVDWWDTSTLARGTITLAEGHTYVSAGPHGVVYLAGTSLRLHSISGAITTLGTPFAAGTSFVVAGSSGLVASTTGAAKYLAFSAPGTFTSLDVGTADLVACYAVSARYAACDGGQLNGEDDDGPPSLVPTASILVPLDGSTPIASTLCPGDTALSGATLIWAGSCTGQSTVYSLRAGGGAAQHAVVNVQSRLITALGSATAATPASYNADPGQIEHSLSSVIGFTSAVQQRTVVSERRSHVSAATFALTPGRVVYADDARVPGQPGALAEVLSRTLRATPASVTAGSPSLLAAGSGSRQVVPALVGASSTVAVYADDYSSHETATLHVVSPYGNATLRGAVGYGTVRVSGNRVLFERMIGGDTHVDVYDVATGRTTLVRTIKEALDPSSTVVWGDYLAYATFEGAVYRENLVSGETVELRAASARYLGFVSVYMDGDWVGWHSQLYSTPSPGDLNEIRNARTLSPTVHLTHTLWSLTSAGAITDDAATLSPEPGDGPPSEATAFRLRSYEGKVTTLLSKRHVVEGPQLVGNALVWADVRGVLLASPVAVDVPRPRSLGDTIAPAELTPGGAPSWSLAAPYSLPLTTCSVSLSRQGASVRRLGCRRSAMVEGVAAVTWDGRGSRGVPVAPGRYVWTIHAGGASGAATDPVGTAAPVSGTVDVIR